MVTSSIDYLATTRNNLVHFQPVTADAHKALTDLRLSLDDQGCYLSTGDNDANALFSLLDAHGLNDLTLG